MHQTIISVLTKVEDTLTKRAEFNSRCRHAMAGSYFALARYYYETDRQTFVRLLGEARRLSTSFASKQPFVYRMIASTFGVNVAERLASSKRRLAGAHSSTATD